MDDKFKQNLLDILWDIARNHSCTTKLKAHRIVMVNKEDLKIWIDELTKNHTNLFNSN